MKVLAQGTAASACGTNSQGLIFTCVKIDFIRGLHFDEKSSSVSSLFVLNKFLLKFRKYQLKRQPNKLKPDKTLFCDRQKPVFKSAANGACAFASAE
jgi:hypothetical protein